MHAIKCYADIDIFSPVTLNLSVETVCPEDTLVFTCTTDTGTLVWFSEGVNEVFFAETGQTTRMMGIFALNLTRATEMMMVLTATVHKTSIMDDKKTVICRDSIHVSNSVNEMIKLAGINSTQLLHNFGSYNDFFD